MTTGMVSVRLFWPFLRVVHDFGPELHLLQAAGVDPQSLSDPDARVERSLLRDVISAAARRTGDVALGVHAGEKVESADFGVMDLATRACPDLRRAMECIGRYVRLLDDDVEMSLVEDGDRVLWHYRSAMPPVMSTSNDFQVTIAVINLLRHLGRPEPPIEVHVRHGLPTDANEYARVYRAPVRYNMPYNGLVLPRTLLDQPVPSANPEAYALFEMRASKKLVELDRAETTTGRVRRLVASLIGREGISMGEIAGRLHISDATLRRRLAEEGTTYRAIVEAVRRDLASQFIAERHVAVGEIASSLGFSSQSAFGRAFRRWTGGSPLTHRLRKKDGARRAS